MCIASWMKPTTAVIQVSVLLHMLNQPLDQSFGVVTMRPPRLDGSIPLLECQDLVVEYITRYWSSAAFLME